MRRFLFYIILLYYNIEYCFLRLLPYKKENTILIFRIDNIGDFILWLDSAKEYRKHYNEKIILVCNQTSYEIAKQLPYFDKVYPINEKKLSFNPIYRLKFFVKFSKTKFKKIINPIYSREYFLQDITMRNLKAEEKIGSCGDYFNTISKLKAFKFIDKKKEQIKNTLKIKGDKFYSLLVPAQEGIVMELNRNAEFIRGVFDKNFHSSLPTLPFEIKQYKDLKEKEYVVLFVGASTKRKVWNREKYAKTIDSIKDKIVVCGGKNEKEIFNDIIKYIKTNNNIVDLVGRTTMMELFSVIKNAKYIITNDTSASHIAPLLRTPSICLLPGVHYGRFQPYQVEQITENEKKYLPKIVNHKMDCYNCNTLCQYINDKTSIWPCISNITVEQVLEKIQEIEQEIKE
ncbi:MAG: glycosyltransferase family 9 protein [Bacteroidales bacterium]|nr:glycosyltransferase family 9 protein [Bacteroidales bacterium]